MAGRLNTGNGSLDPDGTEGELFTLRTEDARFTSLLGGRDGGVVLEKMGVVDPACEYATEPFDCKMTEDPGRDAGVLVSSRDADTLLENRRSQE